MPAALEAGRVDAVWVGGAVPVGHGRAGGRLVASNYVDTAPDRTVALYFTSEQLMTDDPDLVKRFSEAMTDPGGPGRPGHRAAGRGRPAAVTPP